MRFLSRCGSSLAFLALAVTLGTAVAEGQSVRKLVANGDVIFGVGTVTNILEYTVSDGGDWLVLVEAQIGTSSGEVLLRNGIPTLQENDYLITPEGARVKSMELPSFNGAHDIGWNMSFTGFPTTQDTGCFFNSRILAQEGGPCNAPDFGAGTVWKSFTLARLNDSHQVLCSGMVDDPTFSGPTDVALVRFTVDQNGFLLSEEVMLTEGTRYDNLQPLSSIGTTANSLAFNNRGDFMAFVDTTDSANLDGNIFYNQDSIAREGKASPIPGRNWSTLAGPRLDLNDYGDYVYNGQLDGDGATNSIIVKNNQKFVQELDVLPATAPFHITSFQTTPLHVTNAGNVVWFGQINDSDASRNKIIFWDERAMVRIGITRVGSQFINTLRLFGAAFFVPPDGRHLIFWAKLDDGTIGVFLMDLGLVTPMSDCVGNTGKLAFSGGLPLLGERLTFDMDAGQGPGVLPVFMLSTAPVTGWPPCGLDTGITGELLIDVSPGLGNPAYFKIGSPWVGVPVRHHLDIPNDVALTGAEFYAQGLFWDLGDQLPAQNLLLTNGLRIAVAMP